MTRILGQTVTNTWASGEATCGTATESLRRRLAVLRFKVELNSTDLELI